VASKHFSISATPAKVGCAAIVSKKVEKTSVGRHRLKRRMLSCLSSAPIQGYAVVVYARTGSNTLSYNELTQELCELCAKLPTPPQVR
jgi:ribonuclease P protein component